MHEFAIANDLANPPANSLRTNAFAIAKFLANPPANSLANVNSLYSEYAGEKASESCIMANLPLYTKAFAVPIQRLFKVGELEDCNIQS